ncbi:oxygen tolerance protein BatD [Yoonia maritima]|uniref:Oxygen tolerance protein BatD n=1 Tax=Yoonia maritima TaxID=1435347 RepID=A0A2T0VY71_9RHOB|nr:BatD family protein [Yoonia maritima]PRY77166.1 oxygen tolerance protein BatD [Yoonia maritima]
MVRAFYAILLAAWWVVPVWAQTSTVDPDDLTLSVTVEPLPDPLMRQEMVLITIHGIYKRHITLESLEQPDFDGFNWMQLGQDHWFESLLDGRPVKNMRRRMAVFPDKTGTLEIGPFKHHLTLLDENNKWFEHTITSEPVTINVTPEPQSDDWWFPVRGLRVSDDWSNAPDQLSKGEGVLRVIRISALGASPDMIPPMPELTSPSALIFAHPEKRLVDLTSRGPEAIAFWRWTVTPTNGHSAILEPITFSYFDTVAREMREVSIAPQRVAFGDVVGAPVSDQRTPVETSRIHPLVLRICGIIAFLSGVLAVTRGETLSRYYLRQRLRSWRLQCQLRWAIWRHDMAGVRASAHAIDQLYGYSIERSELLSELDSHLFGRSFDPNIPEKFAFRLRQTLLIGGLHTNVH